MSSNFFKPPTDPPKKARPMPVENVVPFDTPKKAGWKDQWHTSSSGQPLPNLFNVMLTLRNHPTLHQLVRFDEMASAIVLERQIPNTQRGDLPRHLTDDDILAIQEEAQVTGLRRIARETIRDGLSLRAHERSFHPVREYLEALTWDGEQRCGGWLSRYLGVEGCEYADVIGRLFLIALVARIYKPGCKADYMLILEGPQGILKSSACRVLAGQWFSDNLPDLSRGDEVRLSMHLRGKWLVEIAELASFTKAEASMLKRFITQTEERYVPKFGRSEINQPRQCLFIGSTNEDEYLKDSTGGRRFWPVRCGEIDIDELRSDRDQLLAEAVALFKSGEAWWPSREFESEHIAPQQASRLAALPWQDKIAEWLKDAIGDQFTTTQVLERGLNFGAEKLTISNAIEVAKVLRSLGWQKKTIKGRTHYARPSY